MTPFDSRWGCFSGERLDLAWWLSGGQCFGMTHWTKACTDGEQVTDDLEPWASNTLSNNSFIFSVIIQEVPLLILHVVEFDYVSQDVSEIFCTLTVCRLWILIDDDYTVKRESGSENDICIYDIKTFLFRMFKHEQNYIKIKFSNMSN